MRENECVYRPLGYVHRMDNSGKFLPMLIVVEVTSYLGENDIVRP